MRHRAGAVAAAALTGIVIAHAQQPAAPERFRHERDVTTAGAGPQRLAIDVPLLVGARPFDRPPGPMAATASGGLADLRLFDDTGARVAHLLIPVPRVPPEWTAARVFPLARTEKTSGFEADLGAAETVDAIAVVGLPAPFLKRLLLEGSGDREHWTVLAREGTLFDLPAEGLRQTEIGFPRGAFRYLRVTWDDTNSGRVPLPSAVRARKPAAAQPPRPLMATLPVERRPSEPGRSRYHITLPGPRLPIVALTLDAPGGHVYRPATVTEPRVTRGEAAPAEIGRTTLTRVVRDGLTAGSLRIPIAPPTEAGVDLTIDDGVNPALEITGATAEFAELPWIYFEGRGRPVVARYGNPSAIAPAYDLEAVRDSVRLEGLPEASWGAVRPIADADPAPPAPPPMPETGAPLDASAFGHSRPIPAGDAALVAVPLDAAALAHSRGPGSRFADVRVIDASGRQVPYLVERRDEPLVMPIAIQPATSALPEIQAAPGHNRSTYRLTLPYAGLPGASLAIHTNARVFRRRAQLVVERQPDRQRRDPWADVIAESGWTHADQENAAPALMLPVRVNAGINLLLTIDEGDNSALPIASVELLLPSYRLRLYRPTGALSLAYGRDDLMPPQYDLALLTPRVMGADAGEVAAGPERASARASGASFVSPRVFWVLLAAAAVMLLALIVRLVRSAE